LQTQKSELSECHKFESVGWHKAGLQAGFEVEGQNNLLGEKGLFYYGICLKQTFVSTTKFS